MDTYEKMLMYYKNVTGRIEIINSQNQMQLMFFIKPTVYSCFSPSTQEWFLENVNRDSPNSKINGLLNKRFDFIAEMTHFSFMKENVPIDLDKWFTTCRWLVLLNIFIINFLILFDSFVGNCEECRESNRLTNPCVCNPGTKTKLTNGITILGIILFAFNVFIFVLWAMQKLKLDLSNAFNLYDVQLKYEKRVNKNKVA